MPQKYAKRVAELLSEDFTERIDVDLIDETFANEVAAALIALGIDVLKEPNRPTHIALMRRTATATVTETA